MDYWRCWDTELEMSEVSFSPMRFTRKKPGGDDRSRTGRQALERPIERGINFAHSSYKYGTRWASPASTRPGGVVDAADGNYPDRSVFE